MIAAKATSCFVAISTASAEAAQHEEQRLLLEALRRIPLDLQIAIELHYWEGMSGPDLAQVLDIPEGTVRSRLRRAREPLLVFFQPGVDVGCGQLATHWQLSRVLLARPS